MSEIIDNLWVDDIGLLYVVVRVGFSSMIMEPKQDARENEFNNNAK